MKRRAPFAVELNRRAKDAARDRVDTIEFEYRRRYNLTINDPRFLDATTEEMLTDIWAHRFKEDPKLLNEFEDEDFNPDDVAAEIGRPQADLEPPSDWETLS